MPRATIETNGNMTISACVFGGQLFTCEFTAPAKNSGPGCAQNVRGTLKTYRPKPFDTVIGSTTFTYTGMVRPGEQFTYRGSGATVPQEDGWTYQTDFLWDNVQCSP